MRLRKNKKKCPACGQEMIKEKKYYHCPDCGTKLVGDTQIRPQWTGDDWSRIWR